MKVWMIYLIVILAMSLVIIGCANFVANNVDDGMPQYRDGTCECGGTWELFSVDVDRGYTYYFYLCDKCGELIKLYEKP